jgi:hypothetical protein
VTLEEILAGVVVAGLAAFAYWLRGWLIGKLITRKPLGKRE